MHLEKINGKGLGYHVDSVPKLCKSIRRIHLVGTFKSRRCGWQLVQALELLQLSCGNKSVQMLITRRTTSFGQAESGTVICLLPLSWVCTFEQTSGSWRTTSYIQVIYMYIYIRVQSICYVCPIILSGWPLVMRTLLLWKLDRQLPGISRKHCINLAICG